MTFKHKGLERFYLTGSKAGIQAQHERRLAGLLNSLAFAVVVEDMALPGYELHPLKGTLEGQWAVKVSGNWRVIFRFEQGNAYIVNYLDYH